MLKSIREWLDKPWTRGLNNKWRVAAIMLVAVVLGVAASLIF